MKKVIVTGATGFLGKHVVGELEKRNYEVIPLNSKNCDMTDFSKLNKFIFQNRPDYIVHLAALCGGIGMNRKFPADFNIVNTMMGINLFEACKEYKKIFDDSPKIVCLGSVCAYPKYTPVPFKEDYLWNGYPEETNAPYGLAKRMLLVQLNAYKEQYGLKGCYLLPANLYGKHDHFDLEDSHVIPALIRKFHEAMLDKKREVLLWGSGSASREFLYVKDAAFGIINAMEKYDGSLPINLGSSKEIKILDLAYLIKDKVGFEGKIVWDYNMPDGQPKRCLDTSRAKELFDFQARWSFEDGIEETIKWYIENREDILRGLK